MTTTYKFETRIDGAALMQAEVGSTDRSAGYSGLVVRIDKIDAMATRGAEQASETSELVGSISAATFGRSVVCATGGVFRAEAGHVQTHVVLHPQTRQRPHRMSDVDVAAFHRKFLTHTTIEAKFGLHR